VNNGADARLLGCLLGHAVIRTELGEEDSRLTKMSMLRMPTQSDQKKVVRLRAIAGLNQRAGGNVGPFCFLPDSLPRRGLT
jgi:hypothetical protein